MAKTTKKVKAPKGAELKLESVSSLKAKNWKARLTNSLNEPVFGLKKAINKSKVDYASKLGKFKK
jgi:hypothetical protein